MQILNICAAIASIVSSLIAVAELVLQVWRYKRSGTRKRKP